MLGFIQRRRKRTVVLAAVAALALPAAALAAWVVYSGLNGSATGNFTSSTSNQAAVTISNNGPAPDLTGPSDSETVSLTITNNNPGASETVMSVVPTFTSTPSVCASHLSYASISGQGIVGLSLDAGASTTKPVTISSDATLPIGCLAGSYTVSFTGTTSP